MRLLIPALAAAPLALLLVDCGGNDATTQSSSTTTSSASGAASSTSSSSGAGGQGGSGGQGGQGGAADPLFDVDKLSKSTQSTFETEPVVAATSDGRVLAAWISYDALGATSIQYAFSTDRGSTWGKVQKTVEPVAGRASIEPTVAADEAGNLVLAWLSFQYGNPGPTQMQIHAAHAGPGETTFSKGTVAIKATSDYQDFPWLVHDKSGAWILGTSRNDGSTYARVQTATSQDGVAWSAPVALPGASLRSSARICTSPSGRLFATYLVTTGQSASVGLQSSDDAGKTWTNEVKVSAADAVGYDEPFCVADDKNVWVSYTLGSGMHDSVVMQEMTAVRVAHSSDGGATFAAAVDAHDGALGKIFQHPSMILEGDGTIDLLYYAGAMPNDVKGALLMAQSTDQGATWTSQKQHSPVGIDLRRDNGGFVGDYLGVARSGKDLHIVYADDAPPYTHIAYRRVPAH